MSEYTLERICILGIGIALTIVFYEFKQMGDI